MLDPAHEVFAMSVGDISGIITAIATIITAIIAAYAATTWKEGLKQSRSDECIAAIGSCSAAIGRVLSLKLNVTGSQMSGPITDAWNTWSVFVTKYEVAKNYRSLSDDIYQKGPTILYKMEHLCQGSLTEQQSKDLNKEFGDLAKIIKKRFR